MYWCSGLNPGTGLNCARCKTQPWWKMALHHLCKKLTLRSVWQIECFPRPAPGQTSAVLERWICPTNFTYIKLFFPTHLSLKTEFLWRQIYLFFLHPWKLRWLKESWDADEQLGDVPLKLSWANQQQSVYGTAACMKESLCSFYPSEKSTREIPSAKQQCLLFAMLLRKLRYILAPTLQMTAVAKEIIK